MYRNSHKSKLLGNLSTEPTLDSFQFKKTKNNLSINSTATLNHKFLEFSKENTHVPLPSITDRDKEKPNPKLILKMNLLKSTNNNDIIRKKIIKGKLIKLVKNSIFDNYTEDEENKVIKPKKYPNIRMNFFPELLGKNTVYVRRNLDILTTPEELIYNNFNEEEIEIIKSNKNFFKINSEEHFKNIEIFKNRHLIEVLEEEDVKIIKKKNISKSILSAVQIKEILRSKKSSNIVKSDESQIKNSSKKKKKISSNPTFSNFPNFRKKNSIFKQSLDKFKNLKDRIDPKIKFLKYEERRNNFLSVMQNNFRKKLDKNNVIRLNAEKKKKIEFEDNRIINTYSHLIKQNYSVQKV